RACLGRALGVRFFVFGAMNATPAGLDVATHMVDAETGARVGGALIRVHSREELKCRLGDLARLTLLDPLERDRLAPPAAAERAAWERQCTLASQRLAAQARVTLQAGNVTLSVQLLEGATALGPAAPPALYDDLARARLQAEEAQRGRFAEEQGRLAAE